MDHFYLFKPLELQDVIVEWELFSPFYTDHFGVQLKINKGENVFQHMSSSIPDYLINSNNAFSNTDQNNPGGEVDRNKKNPNA